jgi:RNA polymerase sigma-70 factor, ECF subfamily
MSGPQIRGASYEAMLAAVAKGNSAAFTELYNALAPRVHRFVVKSLKDVETANDIVHEAYIEVWRKARSYRGECSALTWILAIANNKVRDHLRRGQNKVIYTDEMPEIEDDRPMPFDHVQMDQYERLVRKVLPRLSLVHRQVVDLAYFQNLSIAAIAQIMDCPLNTVKTRMFFARKQLKALLAEEGLSGGTI